MLTAAGAVTLQPGAKAASDEDYRRMRIFTEVLSEIQRKYVEEKTPDQLITEAVKGMVSSLDPHSAYLTPDEYKDLQVETKGSFSGVGIEITMRDGVLTVVSPIEGTPADKAGVHAGDRIIKIDGKLTKGMSLMDAVKYIRGPRGSKVTLTVLREGAGQLKDLSLTRDLIPMRSVRFYLLEDGYGYLRISNFQEDTTEDVVKALNSLQSQKTHLKGLVLDLRNDPGGLLQEAISVADQFITSGVIVSTKGRLPSQDMVFKATPKATAGNYPVICLINNGSASASEIVAGALQDHNRAVILGTASFGKGSVQTIIPLEDKGALRLTTARYYTPSGRAIQAKGIEPDVVVPFEPPQEAADKQDRPQGIREKDLTGAMPAEEEKEEPKADKDTARDGKKEADKLYMPKDRLKKDNQLTRALDLLKAWKVFEKVVTRGVIQAQRTAAQ
ncbi:peptidase S41 [Desulfocarbo indianensis]|nr:peptidase S41 [Desulfocarbo indianensis]